MKTIKEIVLMSDDTMRKLLKDIDTFSEGQLNSTVTCSFKDIKEFKEATRKATLKEVLDRFEILTINDLDDFYNWLEKEAKK